MQHFRAQPGTLTRYVKWSAPEAVVKEEPGSMKASSRAAFPCRSDFSRSSGSISTRYASPTAGKRSSALGCLTGWLSCANCKSEKAAQSKERRSHENSKAEHEKDLHRFRSQGGRISKTSCDTSLTEACVTIEPGALQGKCVQRLSDISIAHIQSHPRF
jgi:hypothetical protein